MESGCGGSRRDASHLAGAAVALEFRDPVEAAALLAEALHHALVHEMVHLKVVLTYLVPLVVVPQCREVRCAALHLRPRRGQCISSVTVTQSYQGQLVLFAIA